MKDEIVVLLKYKKNKDFLIFDSYEECQKFFAKRVSINNMQDLEGYSIYRSNLLVRG